MNRTWALTLGVLATILSSFLGLVYLPNLQLGFLSSIEDPAGNAQPPGYFGTVALGRDVYRHMGCIYCHSQQVRPPGFGADIERGWGTRRSVARDYIRDSPHLLGTMRTGPDLINIAVRQPSREWHHLHLYNPRITSPGSVMPAFAFLYERRTAGAEPRPDDAITLPAQNTKEPAYIVPGNRAAQLVDYLMSLNRTYDVPEIP